MPEHKLVLIDGHALAYRMFYALNMNHFSTKQGEPTNATFGFIRAVWQLISDDNPPQYLAVSFDVGKTFRDDIFEEYKGTREKMPDELSVQIERIQEVLAAFNIPILTLDGFEADDVLGTIAAQAKEYEVPVYIITGDRDLLQLVDENTLVELPTRGSKPAQVFDKAGVMDSLGVRPDQVVDYKALVGDTSDNIPGVRGIGPKTATGLLAEYDTLDNLYAHIDEIKGSKGKKLAAEKESAYLSQKLARIVTDAPITFELEACAARDFEPGPVLDLFHELEFRTLTRELEAYVYEHGDEAVIEEVIQAEETTAVIVRTSKQLKELVKKLNKASLISFDIETTSLDKQTADIVGICLAVEAGTGYYIPVGHLQNEAQAKTGQMGLFAGEPELVEGQLPLAEVLAALRPPLTNPEIGKVAHNAKYDYSILDRHGLTVSPITFDTMLAEWLTDPSSKHKGLKDLAYHRLQVSMTPITDLIGSGRKSVTFDVVAIEDAAPYGAADADITLRLHEKLHKELEEKGLMSLMELEVSLIPILAAMEQAGIGLDQEFFAEMQAELETDIAKIEAEIHEIAGEEFNVNSTQQLSDILFMKLNLNHERLRKTKSGYYSTASDVLEGLLAEDEERGLGIVPKVLDYRELSKIKSTYVDALPALINEETGRLHTSFNQTGTVTGRIASSNPNLQNIPIRSEVGRRIRRGFVARPGWQFLAADYSQVELRILAHVSQDEALLRAFREDQDIHRTTAAAVYNIPVEEVTYNQRRFAKAVNFGLIYGMGAFRLSRDSDLTLGESKEYIAEYFARFPGIRSYLDGTKEEAARKGYTETLLGRRRYFPILQEGKTRNDHLRARAEREAINHPIQGSAADIIKIAMIQLYEKLANFKANMLLQVHDELVLEVPDEELEAVRALTLETMSQAYKLDVPLKVESNIGQNWLEAK
ncbi:MAG TPA: DNA polymerase I [Anaerolineae bacterium]|nr:DNA polymerase I [Anaerolineae bacterium]